MEEDLRKSGSSETTELDMDDEAPKGVDSTFSTSGPGLNRSMRGSSFVERKALDASVIDADAGPFGSSARSSSSGSLFGGTAAPTAGTETSPPPNATLYWLYVSW